MNNKLDFEIKQVKDGIKEVLEKKFEGYKVRSKAKLLDQGEKPSKYFIKREVDNATSKLILKLDTENGPVEQAELRKKFLPFMKNYIQKRMLTYIWQRNSVVICQNYLWTRSGGYY